MEFFVPHKNSFQPKLLKGFTIIIAMLTFIRCGWYTMPTLSNQLLNPAVAQSKPELEMDSLHNN